MEDQNTNSNNENTIKKTITFALPKQEMSITEFLKEGFDRKHISMLFEKLQSLGFGEYVQGKRGRGFSAKFTPNKKCPEIYILEIEQKKRGRKAKNV